MEELEGKNDEDNEDATFKDESTEDEDEGGRPRKRRRGMESPNLRRSSRSQSGGDSSGRTGAGVAGNALYENIRLATIPIRDTVKEWILWYNRDSSSALLDLIQCFVNCAGCQGTITPRMLDIIRYEDLLKLLTEDDEFDDVANSSLKATRVHGRKFRANFKEFLELLFRSCQHCVLMDFNLLKEIVNATKAMCGSTKRQFRHTGTFIVMKLTTAIVETASVFQEKVDRIVEDISNRELRKMNNKFQEILDDLFKSVFIVRYRDLEPEIRGFCIEELGLWILKYPAKFFNTHHLKYIGWQLSDDVVAVKIKCIKALQPLYKSREFIPGLELFTTKFKHRMLEMVGETNNGTVPAIKLLASIFENAQHTLTADDCELVCQLVYAPNRAMAEAAATFLMTMFFETDDRARESNTFLMRLLIEFLIQKKTPDHVIAYVVDSFINIHPMMTDWHSMTRLLQPNELPSDQRLNGNELSVLVKVMVTAVRQTATGKQPEAREPIKKNELELEADGKLLTEQFLTLMVELLDAYAADQEEVSNLLGLLTIPCYFKPSMLTERNVEELLQTVSNIVALHTDEKVLKACAKIFNVFCKGLSNSEESETLKNVLMNDMVDNFLDAAKKYRLVEQKIDENVVEINEVVLSLKKLASFYSFNYFDYGNRDLFESLFYFIEEGRSWDQFPEDIAVLSITTCFHILMQEFYQLRNADLPPEEIVTSYKKKLFDFLDDFEMMICYSRLSLKAKGFTTLCTLLMIFGKPFESPPHLKSLLYKVPDISKAQLVRFIDEFVLDPTNLTLFELEVRKGFLTSFCLLIQHNIIGVKYAANIFKNYVLFSQDYGDIIGEALNAAIKINMEGTARTLVISLSELFTQIKVVTGRIDRKMPAFIAFKDLAKKVSQAFGPCTADVNRAIFALHKDGIGFSVKPFVNPEDPDGPPPNIDFLEVLCEFSDKLSAEHKKGILTYFEKKFEFAEARDGREWSGYEMYQRSLIGLTLRTTRQSSRLT